VERRATDAVEVRALGRWFPPAPRGRAGRSVTRTTSGWWWFSRCENQHRSERGAAERHVRPELPASPARNLDAPAERTPLNAVLVFAARKPLTCRGRGFPVIANPDSDL